jgi:hypothetical protein
MKLYSTPTPYGYRIPADDGECGQFVFVKELMRCREITFSRVHIGSRTLYEYADTEQSGISRYYFTESDQLKAFDLFYTMAIFEVAGMLLSDFEEGLVEAVADKYLNNITE